MSARLRENRLIVRTPEGVVFALPLAGPLTRFLAWLVDCGIVLAAQSALSGFLPLMGVIGADMGTAVAILLFFALNMGYGLAAEWFWRGQTVGKRLLGLRVMDAGGLRLQFSQIALRNLLRAVDILPGLYLAGGLACVLSSRAQRLGDLAANTVVVRGDRAGDIELPATVSGKYNSLRAWPHLEARLRQLVTPQEAGAALAALLRRNTLDPDARVRVFAAFAARFREKVPFPEEATFGLSDEALVRNVLYSLRGRAD